MNNQRNVLANHSPNGAFQGQWMMMKQMMQMTITSLKLPTGAGGRLVGNLQGWQWGAVKLGSTEKQLQVSGQSET